MSGEPLKLVLGVDVLVRALYREDERAVLELWRDGLIRPVLHRPLLRRYLLALQRLGLAEPALRGWGTWLAAPEKSLYLRNTPEAEGPGGSGQNGPGGPNGPNGVGGLSLISGLYLEAARLGGASVVVTGAARPEKTEKRTTGEAPEQSMPELLWLTPAEFLRRIQHDN